MPSALCGVDGASVMSGASSTAVEDGEEDEEEGSAGLGRLPAGFSVGTRVAVPVTVLGDGLFFWLWLLLIKRLAFESLKERERSSSTGSEV